MWFGGDAESTVSTQTAGASLATADAVSTRTGQCYKNTQWLGGQDLHGYLQGWFPNGSSLVLPTPHGSLLSDLEWTGPGRGLPQRQPRSQVAPQPPQFLQPQHPDAQLQPTPHHSLALDLGQSQQRKGCDPGLLLRGTMVALKFTETAGTSLASATTFFGAGHTLKGNEAWSILTLMASTPTTGEQTLPSKPWSREEAPPHIQGSL